MPVTGRTCLRSCFNPCNVYFCWRALMPKTLCATTELECFRSRPLCLGGVLSLIAGIKRLVSAPGPLTLLPRPSQENAGLCEFTTIAATKYLVAIHVFYRLFVVALLPLLFHPHFYRQRRRPISDRFARCQQHVIFAFLALVVNTLPLIDVILATCCPTLAVNGPVILSPRCRQ